MTRHRIFGIFLVSIGFWLCSCADNAFIKFYKPTLTPAQVAKLKSSGDYPTNEFRSIQVANATEIEMYIFLLQTHYDCLYIGASAFNGPLEKEANIKKGAKKVGANFSVTFSEYLETVSGTYTTFIPTYSTTNARAYGSNGSYAYGSATTQSNTPITNSYRVSRYHQEAYFYLCP